MTNRKENEHYEMIPGDRHDQAWHIRILHGDFVETVIEFGAISFNEDDEGVMKFNFKIISTPNSELTEDNVDLQEEASGILENVIKEAIEGNYIASTTEKPE
jgi:hypothetical protein